eukprot:5293919-Pleurochrysis_carterae.AAC.1
MVETFALWAQKMRMRDKSEGPRHPSRPSRTWRKPEAEGTITCATASDARDSNASDSPRNKTRSCRTTLQSAAAAPAGVSACASGESLPALSHRLADPRP